MAAIQVFTKNYNFNTINSISHDYKVPYLDPSRQEVEWKSNREETEVFDGFT